MNTHLNRYTFKGGISLKIGLSPFCKGDYSKKKGFAPQRSRFFFFKSSQKSKQEIAKVASLVKHGGYAMK